MFLRETVIIFNDRQRLEHRFSTLGFSQQAVYLKKLKYFQVLFVAFYLPLTCMTSVEYFIQLTQLYPKCTDGRLTYHIC